MDRTLNPGEAGQQAPPRPQLEGLAALLPGRRYLPLLPPRCRRPPDVFRATAHLPGPPPNRSGGTPSRSSTATTWTTAPRCWSSASLSPIAPSC